MSGFFDSLIKATPLGNVANFSLYSLPVGWLFAIAPHFYAAAIAPKPFDNTAPRSFLFQYQMQQATKPSAAVGKYLRAEAAQQNGFEVLPYFAAAIVAGNAAKLPATLLNNSAVLFLASRVVYNVLYISTTSKPVSNLRSIVYLVGISVIFNLFIQAGKALQ